MTSTRRKPVGCWVRSRASPTCGLEAAFALIRWSCDEEIGKRISRSLRAFGGGMDYVDWVEKVMASVARAWKEADANTKLLGLELQHVSSTVCDDHAISSDAARLEEAIRDALHDLTGISLLDVEYGRFWKVTSEGNKYPVATLSTAWPSIMTMYLDDDELEFLEAIAKIGQEELDDLVCLRDLTGEQVSEELGWDWGSGDKDQCLFLATRLAERGLLTEQSSLGGNISIVPTYMGIVRATRQVETKYGSLIREKLDEWETTNVDFKRELNLKCAKEKAEFVRDALGLATTKSTGQRFLIIGFDNDSRVFHSSVDPTITIERLEQILHAYCEPSPDIRYTRVPWDRGVAGVIEVLREPARVPYRVKKSLGGNSGIRETAVYVRHGSHTEAPTAQELTDLIEEGRRARAS